MSTFELYICSPNQHQGSVVQLVRIHACHAWGRGFESRPDRKKALEKSKAFCFLCFLMPYCWNFVQFYP